VDAAAQEPRRTQSRSGAARLALVSAAALAAAIGWSYRTSFARLIDRWTRDDNYTYGWLIVPIALGILWQRREHFPTSGRASWWSPIPLIGLLAWRYWLFERNDQWIEGATIPLVVGATVLAIGGWSVFKWALPAILYLFLMIPLPPSLNEVLASPLQSLATIGSVSVLQAIGQPVIAEGNVIWIGGQRLEVAEACRGLSMLLAFVSLITAMVIFVKRPLWERLVLLASTIPIALISNIIRIAVTAVLYRYYDRPVKTIHDWAGLAMMVLAIGFVALELKIMEWLVIEDELAEPGVIRAPQGVMSGPRV
jgi:exosortase